jgi:uncharacterized protein (TIGR00725 family)
MERIIGVIGAGRASPELYRMAEQVGQGIAQNGATLVCGGLGGVMEAACKGAKAAGGRTVGILPGERATEANKFVDLPIVTGFAEARNVVIVRSAHAVIAIGGEFGTLSEMAFALKFGVPLIGLQSWSFSDRIQLVETPEEAVVLAIELAARRIVP